MKQPFQLKIKQNERLLTNIAQNLHIARQTGRQTDRQTDRQADRKTETGRAIILVLQNVVFLPKNNFL